VMGAGRCQHTTRISGQTPHFTSIFTDSGVKMNLKPDAQRATCREHLADARRSVKVLAH
jgi:hypothetical protein